MDLPCHPLLLATLFALCTAPVPAQEGWVSLFDGKSLAGWKASEHPDSVKVVDGMIYCDGPRAHLFYLGDDGKAEFENFELELEVKAMPGANSGVYFHATWEDAGWPRKSGTEVQVNNNQPAFDKNYIENKKTGSLYGFRNLYKAMAQDGEWFTLNIQVRKPRAQVRINGKLMIDYIEPANVPVLVAGATRDILTKGTFALQCHDEKSQTWFRNIRVRRLPPGEDASVTKPVYNDADRARQVLARDNFPLVNLQTYLTDKLTLEQMHALRNQTGIFPGVVYVFHPNQRSMRDEATAQATLTTMQNEPVFVGLDVSFDLSQDTPKLSLATQAKFDFLMAKSSQHYVYGAFSGSQLEANRMMDAQVGEIVRKIETLPIDIYANVMLVSLMVKGPAEEMWTEERMQRVIAAAAKNGVAFEINPRLRTPSEQFIKLAKAAGVKFTVGADDTTADNYADWSYILEMQKAAGLTWRNMWVPGHEPTRAQREIKKP